MYSLPRNELCSIGRMAGATRPRVAGRATEDLKAVKAPRVAASIYARFSRTPCPSQATRRPCMRAVGTCWTFRACMGFLPLSCQLARKARYRIIGELDNHAGHWGLSSLEKFEIPGRTSHVAHTRAFSQPSPGSIRRLCTKHCCCGCWI